MTAAEKRAAQLKIVEQFSNEQTLTNIGIMRQNGIQLKKLNAMGTLWEPLDEYTLPLSRFIPLYNDQFELSAIGVY